jgi:polyisoprenoid-binding protein YceI
LYIFATQTKIIEMKKLLFILTLSLFTASVFSQKNFMLDKNHSRLSFTAKHFGISHVEGNFKIFDATLKTNKEDFTDALIEMTAEVISVNTDVEMRDKDLRSSNWFDAEKYPKLIFKSTAFKKISGNNYKLEGSITMHGITKPITFNVVYNGKALNPVSKKYAVGFTVTGKLKRTDFSIGTELFAGVVGNEIEVQSNVEFIIN